jgi:putative membrane protein
MAVLSFLARWVLLAAAVALTAWVLPDVALEGGVWSALWVALLFGLLNVVAQLLLVLLPRPTGFWLLLVLTLLLNGLLVWVVSAVTSRFTVDGFIPAVGAAMLITVFSVALTALAVRLLPDEESEHGAMAG